MATKRRAGRNTGAEAGSGSGPFSLQEVKALVAVVEGTDVTSLVWSRSGHKVVIRRGQAPAPAPHAFTPAPPAPAHAAPASAAPAAPVPPRVEAVEKPGVMVTSPFVGTFYRAPSPDLPPYVDVGARVKKGQVLCIVEAMKLMNEIEAEVEGVVAEVLAANATPVEFGQPLFRIEPG